MIVANRPAGHGTDKPLHLLDGVFNRKEMTMNIKQDGGPAFPVKNEATNNYAYAGLSIRDWFAGQALVGLISGRPDSDCDEIGYAMDSYRFADAMLKARE